MKKPRIVSDIDWAEQTINDAHTAHLNGETITPDRMVDVVAAFGHVANLLVAFGKALETHPDSITEEEEREATAFIQDLADKSNALMQTFDHVEQISIQVAGAQKYKESNSK